MHFPARLTLGAAGLSACLLLQGCDKPAPPATSPQQTVATEPRTTALSAVDREQLATFQETATAIPQSLVACTAELQTSLMQFLKQVDADHLQTLRAQWAQCHDIYLAASTLQGYTPAQQAALKQAHAQLGNPLAMPGFIDSVEGYPFSGIVNDASLQLGDEELRQQHGLTDEADVSIGFNVVGFLLWGEHIDNSERVARPFTDFATVEHWEDSSEDLPIKDHPHNRRRDMLQLTIELLSADSQNLLNAWVEGALPATQEQAKSWEMSQLHAFNDALQQWPDNKALPGYLQRWLEKDALPAIPANLTTTTADPASPATPLRAQLKNKLNTVPTMPD